MKKLRNKKTGEVGNLVLNINPNRESYSVLSTENGDTICGNLVIADYDTLAELNAEWQDYEEPKAGYIIDPMEKNCVSSDDAWYDESDIERAKELGIWFETEEEAEKAVEKLKAWTRLKDKGFQFTAYNLCSGSGVKDKTEGEFVISAECSDFVDTKDLDLLFGGDL